MFDSTDLIPIVFVVAFFISVVLITRTLSEGAIRRRLIQAGTSAEHAQVLLARHDTRPGADGALKWGLLIGAVGLGLIVIQFLPYRSHEPLNYGVILLFSAAGLLSYYALSRRLGHSA